MPENGDLVFIDGNQAAVVIGEGVADDGTPDGSVIVGLFAGARQVEKGHYGQVASVEGENPPSVVPEGAPAITPEAQPIVAPSAGGLETAEPVATGATDTEVTAIDDGTTATTSEREAEQDAEIARLRAELDARSGDATTLPGDPNATTQA